jgi:hypothetical protein
MMQELTRPLACSAPLCHIAPATNCWPMHRSRSCRACAAAPGHHRTAAVGDGRL